MIRCNKCITFLFSFWFSLVWLSAHPQQTGPIGINFVLITFDQPPTTLSVNKCPLKYNKDFALSMQIEDADLSIYTHAFPVFEGGVVDGTSYPGFFYTDGCGNLLHYKMSSSVYSFGENGINGPDIHLNNAAGQTSWGQMDTLYNNNWGILNHGVSGLAATDPVFMNYSIKRNQSYIRRQLYNTTEGGVTTRVHVNPDGAQPYTAVAFGLGYHGTLNQNTPSPLGDHGGDVNNPSVDWSLPQSLYRVPASAINVQGFVTDLADSSTNNANYWGSIFSSSLVSDYPFTTFVNDFVLINSLYGLGGLDNLWMASDEEIIDYLAVRDLATPNYLLNNTMLLITFSGDIPTDLLYYTISLNVESDATITNIIVDGTDDYSATGIGSSDALLNLNWDGHYVVPPEVLADSFTTIALTTQSLFDAWVAMDYVITMENGPHKDSLRQLLCAIPSTVYDEGFCDCSINLDQDTITIVNGDCADLIGAEGDYTYEWYVADTLIDTTQIITVCPQDTTKYFHIATNPYGCPSEDSILVCVSFLSVNLGEDLTICQGNCVTLEGPPDMASYQWYVDSTVFDTLQMVEVCPMDTSIYSLVVTDSLGNQAGDSISINVLPAPQVDLGEDAAFCLGDSLYLSAPSAPEGETYTYLWNQGATTQNIWVYPDVSDSTFVYYVDVTTDLNGCVGSDTIYVTVWFQPNAILSFSDSSICVGNALTASALPPSQGEYKWTYNGQTLSSGFISYVTIKPAYSQWITVEVIAPLQAGGCSDTDSLFIEVTPPPEITVTNDTSICMGDSVILMASGGDLYAWFKGGTMIGTDSTIKVSPNIITSYVVFVTRLNGCSNSDTVVVDLYARPTPSITYDSIGVCVYAEVILYAEGGAHYTWTPGNDTLDSLSVVLYDTTTIYLTAYSVEGCPATDSVILKPLPPPDVSLTGLLPAYCLSDPQVVLYGEPPGGFFSGEGISDSLFSPGLAGAGTHQLVYRFMNADLCMGYDTVTTIIYGGGLPIDLGADTTIPLHDSIILDAGSGFDRVYWSTGDTSRYIVLHDGDRPPGTYQIVVVGVINGCTSQGSIHVTFLVPDGMDEYATGSLLIYPNPNDGRFSLIFKKAENNLLLTLYDIHGKEIFRKDKISCNPECRAEVYIPGLHPGIYYVRLASAHQVHTSKVVVR